MASIRISIISNNKKYIWNGRILIIWVVNPDQAPDGVWTENSTPYPPRPLSKFHETQVHEENQHAKPYCMPSQTY